MLDPFYPNFRGVICKFTQLLMIRFHLKYSYSFPFAKIHHMIFRRSTNILLQELLILVYLEKKKMEWTNVKFSMTTNTQKCWKLKLLVFIGLNIVL